MVTVETDGIPLPLEKAECDRRLMSQAAYDDGEMLTAGRALRELRGYYAHWPTENPTWGALARPVAVLPGFLGPAEICVRGSIY